MDYQPFDMTFDRVEPRRKKVAIVGFSLNSLYQAPFADPAWEVWGENQLYRFIPRATRWFEIHTRRAFLEDLVRDTDYVAWIQRCPIPVYMVERFEDIPSSVEYPLGQMIAEFGDYFTSSISYMLALAISEGFEEIGVWGVDMVADEEYGYQRDGCHYLLGVARGRGIRVTLPPQSALMRAYFRYGYQEPPYQHMLVQLLRQRESLRQRRDTLAAEVNAIDGALQIVEQWLKYVRYAERGQKLDIPVAVTTST